MNQQGSVHRNKLRLGFLLPYLLPPLLIAGVAMGGAWSFLPVLVVFGAIPLIDLWLGRDKANPAADIAEELARNRFYDVILYAWVPIQFAVLTWAVWSLRGPMEPTTMAGLILSTGVITGGIGITVAHELGHRRKEFERSLARVLLISVAYLHFYVEHNRGHHARVATPEDPASARFGEGFYRFFPRTVIGSWRSAWHFEIERLSKRGLGFWHPRNQMLWAMVGPAILAGLAFMIAGLLGLLFFVAQAFIAFSLLELVNYIEHYGLERKPRNDGYYQRVDIHHSWNASERLTNFMLFNLQRHSHHHAHAITPYQSLRHFDDSPQLPTGYAGMIILALIPPVWHRIMDPRAERYRREVLKL